MYLNIVILLVVLTPLAVLLYRRVEVDNFVATHAAKILKTGDHTEAFPWQLIVQVKICSEMTIVLITPARWNELTQKGFYRAICATLRNSDIPIKTPKDYRVVTHDHETMVDVTAPPNGLPLVVRAKSILT